ncbi:DTW domain-containing protein 1 [Elysia marginata]|uniref:tRNA-uridine aminocarboxypropyltransferase 1 n=1 Tax=Elysia marginata TaxID=1093978 RepID=A0AAV4GIU2_9GAST|nr:DTW domain-containing protein 1 [Elysia marginata]
MEGCPNNPFPSTVISDWTFLDSTAERSVCPLCRKSRKYFCYTCLIALPHIADRIPKIQLPVTVDIIKHPNEIDGKSTSCHAAVLAPNDVRVFTYPCIPDYDPQKTVLVFPSEDSVSLDNLKLKLKDKLKLEKEISTLQTQPTKYSFATVHSGSSDGGASLGSENNAKDLQQNQETIRRKRCHEQNSQTEDLNESPFKQAKLCSKIPFEKVVLIDSTWNQTRNIASDERLKSLTKVELKSQNTNFWRRQEGIPKSYLSTIEAIYYFVRDVHTIFLETEYANEYDNLLFFFCFMYNKIQSSKNNVKKKK